MSAVDGITGHQGRVLIVDDELQNREVLRTMLKPEGLVLMMAASGQEALTLAEELHPDLILLDVMMPDMDGYAVVTKLKANAITTNIPVIMVTALDDRTARLRGLDAGAEDFLSKPLDRAELRVRVRNLLRLKTYGDFHRAHGQNLEREVTSQSSALAESEKRYREIVESTTDGIVKVDASATVVFANRRFADMMGYELGEIIGKSALAFVDGTAHAVVSAAFQRCRDGVRETYEVIVRRKDGGELAVSVASTPIHDETGRFIGAVASARDVTEQTKILAQLTVSDRMASIGTLAAGVAHEINNPLACVMANLDMAAQDVLEKAQTLGVLAEMTDVREELADAREAAERIRKIVGDLKIFSRSDDDAPGPVDMERVVESALRMAWNEIRHRARVVRNYGNTPPVLGSEARLGQVVLNLIVNAAQAIAEGRAENNEIRVTTTVDPGGDVILEIGDTGPGMSPEILNQLFTPFFTTKAAGAGTGLGLSICHRIVTGFGGTIDVHSDVGRGTTFRVSLPQAGSGLPPEPPAVAAKTIAVKRGRILVIDEEPLIGKAVQRALSAEHDVVAIGSARQALERIGAGERFDVILCDLMMPQMTGMDLQAALSGIAGGQGEQMIFLTGGAFTPRARAFLEQTTNDHIEKPFDLAHLRALVNGRIAEAVRRS